MKINVEIQHAFKNVTSDEIERRVQDDIVNRGIKLHDISSLNIYYKTEEHAIYYVAVLDDDEIAGTGNTPLYLY